MPVSGVRVQHVTGPGKSMLSVHYSLPGSHTHFLACLSIMTMGIGGHISVVAQNLAFTTTRLMEVKVVLSSHLSKA